MNCFRLAPDELAWLARARRALRAPDWVCEPDHPEQTRASLLRKRILLEDGNGATYLDPAFAYLFARMQRAKNAVALSEKAFLYGSDPFILLTRDVDSAPIRLFAFEDAQQCANFLREEGLLENTSGVSPVDSENAQKILKRLVEQDEQ